jgi:thioredoxin reductase (NADPH)
LFRNSKFEIRNLPLDGLFVAIGHKPATGFLKDSGVLLDRKGYIYTSGRVAYELQAKKEQNFGIDHNLYNYDYQFTTNVPGIFAAGDCVDHVYRQATTAVGMGVAAELEVEKWLLSLDIRQ